MASLVELYACMPGMERGQGILVDGNARLGSIIYCNGRSVIILGLREPLRVDIYSGHSYPTTVARWSPNGEWVASADVSGAVRIWGSSGEHTLRYEYRALSGRIDDLQWSPDGERIVVAGDGKGKSFVRAFIWDSGSSVGDFEGSSKRVLSCAFKPTRPFRIATGGEDFVVNFYEGPPFRFKVSHREHGNYVNCVRFSPDGSKLLSVGSDKKIVVYDAKTGEKIASAPAENGHTGSIYAVSWSSSSNQVLTVSADKTAKLWSVAADGAIGLHSTFSFTGGSGADDMQVGCLWLGDLLVTISLGGKMSFLSVENPGAPPKKVLSGHVKSITAVSASDEFIYSSSYDGSIIKWRAGAGYVETMDSTGLIGGVHGLSATKGEVIARGQNKLLRVCPKEGSVDLGADCTGFSVALEASETVVACTEREVFVLHDFIVVSKVALQFTATSVAVSPDAKAAAIGSKDGKIYIYSITDNALNQEGVLERHRAAVTALEFSPNGSMVASGDQNREAFVWDWIKREVKLKNMLYHTARITCVSWSADSSRVATGSVDGCVFVYDVEKAASSRASIKGAHAGGVTGLAFINSRTFVSGGSDAILRVWNVA